MSYLKSLSDELKTHSDFLSYFVDKVDVSNVNVDNEKLTSCLIKDHNESENIWRHEPIIDRDYDASIQKGKRPRVATQSGKNPGNRSNNNNNNKNPFVVDQFYNNDNSVGKINDRVNVGLSKNLIFDEDNKDYYCDNKSESKTMRGNKNINNNKRPINSDDIPICIKSDSKIVVSFMTPSFELVNENEKNYQVIVTIILTVINSKIDYQF